MAKSNKPIVWGLFAAGGTFSAFIMPALVLLTLLAAFGYVPEILAYEHLHSFLSHWLGKLILFALIFLSLWHAAHRLRITLHDFGVRADILVATLLYIIAGLGTLGTIVYLLAI
jgi:fumarate reductase subunit D